jgi:hypothetical protein
MPSIAVIEAELERLRATMERVQSTHDTTRCEIQEIMQKRREAQRIMNGGRSQAERDSA